MTVLLPNRHVGLVSAALLAAVLIAVIHAPPTARAAAPTCGATLSLSTVLTTDLDCTGFVGTALTIGADGIIFDGAGYKIIAPDASVGLSLPSRTGVTVSDLSITGAPGTGVSVSGGGGNIFTTINAAGSGQVGRGLQLINSSNNTIDGLIATDRSIGLYLTGTANGNQITSVDATGSIFGVQIDTPATGNVLTNVDAPWIGATRTGEGVLVNQASGNTLEDLTASNRVYGVRIVSGSSNTVSLSTLTDNSLGVFVSGASTANTVSDSTLTGNSTAVAASGTGSSANRYLNNDFSNSTSTALSIATDSLFVLSGNTYANSGAGIGLSAVDSVTLSGIDLSTITGTSLSLSNVTNSSFSNILANGSTGVSVNGGSGNTFTTIDAAGSAQVGRGLQLINSSSNTIDGLIATDRSIGLYLTGTANGNQITSVDATGSIFGVQIDTPATGNVLTNVDAPWIGATRTGEGVLVNQASGNTLEDLTASNRVYGVRIVSGSSNTVSLSTLTDNSLGVFVSGASTGNTVSCSDLLSNNIGISSQSTSANPGTIEFNHIEGNTSAGLSHSASVLLDARTNYWGAADGPNPPGSGDTVVGNVDISGFAASRGELDGPCDRNEPPEITAFGRDAIDEGNAAAVTLTFADPDEGDVLGLTVAWGDGGPQESHTEVVSPLTLSHYYGDNGSYIVTLQVCDTAGQCDDATTTVDVANVAPSLTLDLSGAISFPGGTAFIGRAGDPQDHTAMATDPGSDDLTIIWEDGSTTIYFNDVGPDPLPSPGGTFPFTVSDTDTVTFTGPGVFIIEATVTDDDGASDNDSLTKIVTDVCDCTESKGFWKKQFSDKGKQHIDDDTLQIYLEIVGFTSSVFGPLALPDANAVFDPPKSNNGNKDNSKGNNGSKNGSRSGSGVRGSKDDDPDDSGDDSDESGSGSGGSLVKKRQNATAQTLAAWLNFAKGAVDWDEEITVGRAPNAEVLTFGDLIAEVELILNDDASKDDLERAKDLAEAVNQHDKNNPDCETNESVLGTDFGSSSFTKESDTATA